MRKSKSPECTQGYWQVAVGLYPRKEVSNGVFATIRWALTENLLLDDERPVSVVPYVAELLDEAYIQVLVYNGDRDLRTYVQGSETFWTV
jgi:hypothetical protein